MWISEGEGYLNGLFLIDCCFPLTAEVDIENDFEVSLDIGSLQVILNLLMRVREQDFVQFPLRNALELNCWLATIPPPELDAEGFRIPGTEPNFIVRELATTLSDLNMGINCFNCTSTGLKEWNELLQEPGAADKLTEVANSAVADMLQRLTGGFLQDQIDSLLVSARKQCPHTRDSVDPNAPGLQFATAPVVESNDTVYLTFLLAIVIPLAFAVILILGVRRIVHRRHRKWMRELPSERVFLIQQKQEKEEHMETELNEMTNSMYESEQVSLHGPIFGAGYCCDQHWFLFERSLESRRQSND